MTLNQLLADFVAPFIKVIASKQLKILTIYMKGLWFSHLEERTWR
jgi:hypothetical protein